jgi:hypothetical protein
VARSWSDFLGAAKARDASTPGPTALMAHK